MTNDAMLEAERACSRLLSRYAHAVDAGDTTALLAVFTVDGVFDSGLRRLEGAAALSTLCEGRAPEILMRHLIGSVLVTVESSVEAGAFAYYALYRGDKKAGATPPLPMDMPYSMGEYRVRFRWTPEGWRISRVEVQRLFAREASRT